MDNTTVAPASLNGIPDVPSADKQSDIRAVVADDNFTCIKLARYIEDFSPTLILLPLHLWHKAKMIAANERTLNREDNEFYYSGVPVRIEGTNPNESDGERIIRHAMIDVEVEGRLATERAKAKEGEYKRGYDAGLKAGRDNARQRMYNALAEMVDEDEEAERA